MTRRTVTTICPEGWYYLFVVVFILGGATLRSVNLLIVLGGMLIGPFLFNWRVVKLMLRRVRVERPLPTRICAGQVLHVPVTIHNDRSWLSSWTVVVEDRLERMDEAGASMSTRVRIMAPRIAPQHNWVGGYEALLTQRGRYRFGPLKVSTRFPLGLAKASFVQQQQATLLVCPPLGTLTPRWSQVTGRDHQGDRRETRRHGFLEGDYYGLREWRPGDSKRWIHWRTSARLGKLAVRQFERQRQRDLALVLDLWHPDAADEEATACVETAVSFLATVVADLGQHGDSHVAIGIAAAEQQLWSGPASSILTYEVWDHLALVQPHAEGELVAVLDAVRQQARPDTPLIVISTRACPQGVDAAGSPARSDTRRNGLVAAERMTWIDCRQDQHQAFFTRSSDRATVPGQADTREVTDQHATTSPRS